MRRDLNGPGCGRPAVRECGRISATRSRLARSDYEIREDRFCVLDEPGL
jgi:hypothetical protein